MAGRYRYVGCYQYGESSTQSVSKSRTARSRTKTRSVSCNLSCTTLRVVIGATGSTLRFQTPQIAVRPPWHLEAVSLLSPCFHWSPTSSSRRSLRFAARKRSLAYACIPHSGQRCRRWPEWGMPKVVGGFDPSLEPLRPMGQAHRGDPLDARN